MKVLITGAGGNLGIELVRVFQEAGHDVTPTERDVLDITDEASIQNALRKESYGFVINAAAYNAVDAAESEDGTIQAMALNARAPGILAKAACESGAGMVHYSSDYVFDGSRTEGYTEGEAAQPISRYGISKLGGEQAVEEASGNWFVIRSSKLFGPRGISAGAKPGFADLMLKLANEKPELAIIDEEIGMPTFTTDLAEATLRLIEGGYPHGVYHLVNEGPGVTWYGFAEEIFSCLLKGGEYIGANTPRKPVPSSYFPPRPAKRPMHAALKNTNGPRLRPRIEALYEYLSTIVPTSK